MLGILAVFIAACGDVGEAPEAEIGEAVSVAPGEGVPYAIDTTRSAIRWRGAKATRAHEGGFELFSGTVYVNRGVTSGVLLNIQTPSIYSDTERLTEHLKSGDFFGVDTHPVATFEATDVVLAEESGARYRVTGNLTMRGQTNSVTFPADIRVEDDTLWAEADFIIDRQRWGISYPGQPDDLIGDQVRLLLDITAVQRGTGAAGEPGPAAE